MDKDLIFNQIICFPRKVACVLKRFRIFAIDLCPEGDNYIKLRF